MPFVIHRNYSTISWEPFETNNLKAINVAVSSEAAKVILINVYRENVCITEHDIAVVIRGITKKAFLLGVANEHNVAWGVDNSRKILLDFIETAELIILNDGSVTRHIYIYIYIY